MSHTDVAVGADPIRDPDGRYRSKRWDSRRDKRQRIEKRTLDLMASYDVKTPADLAIIALAAAHLDDAQTARSRLSRTRSTNASMRLLRELRRREPESVPTNLKAFGL